MAARGKRINLFLKDGEASGRIKCTLANWTGIEYKIPRTELEKCKERDDLNKAVSICDVSKSQKLSPIITGYLPYVDIPVMQNSQSVHRQIL